MTLDVETCWAAVRSRDRRFEGRFVLAVRTTGIYCRPGCPARTPRRENVVFLPTAAAAETAGFRPCLRCRPDAAPDTPAWSGTSATVARALRLIGDGTVADGGLDELAGRLGIGARHLRRLFHEHLGAPPRVIALTRRVHFARQLVEQTAWPMADVAAAAGFGSLRRFNDAMRATYGRAPGAFRRGGAAADRVVRPLVLRLPYRAPYDHAALLGFLAERAIPGVEQVEGGVYRRAAAWAGGTGIIEVAPAAEGDALVLSVEPPGGALVAVVARVKRLFDLDSDPAPVAEHLGRDPLLGPLVRQRPGLRVPGAWDPFELAVRAFLGQQVSVRAARTLAGRLAARWGTPLPVARPGLTHVFPGAAALAAADLSGVGLTGARARALSAFAGAVASGAVALHGGPDLDETVRRLAELPGVGPWTAQYVAMRALGEPDAFPDGDLGLRKALSDGPDPASAAALRRRAEAWRPWRAYAALHLWTSLGDPPAGEER